MIRVIVVNATRWHGTPTGQVANWKPTRVDCFQGDAPGPACQQQSARGSGPLFTGGSEKADFSHAQSLEWRVAGVQSLFQGVTHDGLPVRDEALSLLEEHFAND